MSEFGIAWDGVPAPDAPRGKPPACYAGDDPGMIRCMVWMDSLPRDIRDLINEFGFVVVDKLWHAEGITDFEQLRDILEGMAHKNHVKQVTTLWLDRAKWANIAKSIPPRGSARRKRRLAAAVAARARIKAYANGGG